MSRSVTKWKLEKAKVKVVFRLQFHATHIPQSGWEKLFISFIPTETGKATAKTSKANVRNGSCKWADPIYETTRLLIDSKTKLYDDKLYKLIVGMGTSRSSILGEATINLADYADASQPSSITLPLHGSETILHVTVQLLTAKTGFREFEQQRDKGLQRESEPSTTQSPSSDILIPDEIPDKVKTKRQVRSHTKDLLEETGIHEEYSDSQVTCDDSSNTSETYKNDLSNSHEVDSIKNRVVSMSDKRNGCSDDLALAYEENQRLRGSLEVAESAISDLKLELNTLHNHASEMTTETQKLQQELVNEIASSQELMKEVTVLKSECSKFKTDLQQLKETKSIAEIPILPLQEPGPTSAFDSSERESLVKKMEQMESYYEALVQNLEENQKKILQEFQTQKDQMLRFEEERCELSSINKDLTKRVTTSESALKRARLNYSIAVSQLQKDLDMLSFQVLSMFETNQTVIKEAFSDSSQGDQDLVDDHVSNKNLSGDLKKSLSLQENIYKKVEEELGEMCCSNLYLDVYSGTLKETLMEASVHVRKMKEKVEKLEHELEVSNQSRDDLFMRLQNVMEDVHDANMQNEFYVSKCNDLELQNQMLETDLGSVSREKFSLMEKITECEALVMEYKVHKSRHEIVSFQKLEVEGVLEVQVLENKKLEKDMSLLKGELEALRSQIHDLEKEKDMARFEHELVSFQKHEVEGVLEVQVLENKKLEKDMSLLKGELEALRSQIHDLEKEKDMARFELDDVKGRFKNGLHEMVVKLGNNPNESLEKVQFQLESVSNKLKKGLESGERHVENSELVLRYLSSMELELQKMMSSEKDRNFIELETMAEELEKGKLVISELHQENQDFVLEVDRLKECLRCVNDELLILKDIKGKLEGELESQRSKVDHVRKLASDQESENSICEDLKLTFVKSQYQTKIEELVKQGKELGKKNLEKEARLNDFVIIEAQYIKENEKLSRTLESIKLELEAETLKSENESKKWKELQMKLDDMEARLNEVVKSEAFYIEENKNLSRTLESVQMELQDSIAHNAKSMESKNILEGKLGILEVELQQSKDTLTKSESRLNDCIKENQNLSTTIESLRLELQDSVSESSRKLESSLMEVNNQHGVEFNRMKDILAKSEAEIWQLKELQVKLHDTEMRLNEVLEENNNLSKTLESLRLELEASFSQNAEISEANNENILEIGQLKDKLVKSEVEIGQLQVKVNDTEARLNSCLENEAHYIQENEKLSRTLESVQLELESLTAQNAEISEAKSKDSLEISQLKDTLVKSEVEIGQLQVKLHENEANYIKETKNLASELESCRLELQASIAQIEEISKSNNIKVKELETKLLDTKQRLDQIVKSESFYIEENESLKSELHAINKKVTFLENNEVDDVLFMKEESEIMLLVLKAKLDEKNDESIMIQNKCNQLKSKLSEQILKTEEFKNLSIYLKEIKEKSEKKDPEGPTESLRLAFIKEQHQAKLQELKQQLSVSKRHGEEMLFKLQDALEEIETRKRSQVLQTKRIEELESEVESVISEKADHDRIQAELECAILSLECCKQEKEKVVALLQESEEAKSKLEVEVSLIKERKDEFGHRGVNGGNNLQAIEGGVVDNEDEENSLVNDSKQLMVVNDQFRSQQLRSCMEQLDEELEKMKNDNSILPLTNYDPGFQDLHTELSQLQKANEELGSIYPNFIDFPGNGNALQRVLALEIELAEALKTKKKSSIQFQSSFLKQHSDEEAVLKSFRDINELIKDMLEIKGKYVNVESELKEMHERYSQLSLQFAEVEGERQKLMMTLKNVRSSRNLLRLNRSSMTAIEDRKISENDAVL